MPVIREWTCECGCEFERVRPECTSCGSTNVRRAFRTPPGINGGSNKAFSAKRTDQILEHQFNKLGISNFKTMEFGRPNKVVWSPKRYRDRYADQTDHGVAQPDIEAGWGPDALLQSGLNPGGLKKEGAEFQIPMDIHGAYIPPGTAVGGRPTALYNQTNVVGGIDVVGNQVVRVK